MKPTAEAVISIAAAFLVLLSAMRDSRVSAVIAIAALTGLAIYKLAVRQP